MKFLQFLVMFGVFVYCYSGNVDNPIVRITEGRVKGAVKNLLDGSPYYSFKGIRYARAPVGNLRFKAPQPPEPFEEIFDATEHGPECTQISGDLQTHGLIKGSEDCLRLNIYTKTLNPNSKVPVMVFVHGGGFWWGSGDDYTYGPELLLQHDVILVTINYRLEVLGFLSLDTPEVPGNAGMKDQSAALKWVKNNIANFGGDPDNVTLFGESGGSGAVTYHILSPLSRGLFHKVIAQSGTCIQDWALARDAKERAFRVAKNLGKETESVDELLEFLQSVPATSLVNHTHDTSTFDEQRRGVPITFVPNVEIQFDIPDQFITAHPLKILLENKVNSVPLMIGYNSAEGILRCDDLLNQADFLDENPSYLVPRQIMEKVTQNQLEEYGERIKNFFFGNKITPTDVLPAIDMTTDIDYMYNTYRFSDIYAKSNGPLYLYRFDFSTELNMVKHMMNRSHFDGACHADDLTYLFYGVTITSLLENQNLQKITYDVTKLWADFAITGNPTPQSSVANWPVFSRSDRDYLNINESWSAGKHADKARLEFWDKLYCDAGLPCIAINHSVPPVKCDITRVILFFCFLLIIT